MFRNKPMMTLLLSRDKTFLIAFLYMFIYMQISPDYQNEIGYFYSVTMEQTGLGEFGVQIQRQPCCHPSQSFCIGVVIINKLSQNENQCNAYTSIIFLVALLKKIIVYMNVQLFSHSMQISTYRRGGGVLFMI